MRKKYLLIPSLIVLGSLTACGNNNDTAMDYHHRDANPYTHRNDYSDVRDDNGEYNRSGVNTNNYNRVGYNTNGVNHNRNGVNDNSVEHNGSGVNDNGYNRNEVNDNDEYNPDLTRNTRYQRVKSNTKNNTIASKINQAVEDIDGVQKARTVTYGDNVLVAVTKTNNANQNTIEKSIRSKVNSYVTGKDVKVYFGETNYRKLDDIHGDIMDGKDINITNRIKNSFENVKRNVKNIDIIPNNR